MLSWVGKRPLREVRAFPAQLVSRFEPRAPQGAASTDADWSDWPERFDRGGLLFHGDNKEVLAHLLANGFRGKVDLVYIDPPFDSGADYVRKVQLRGPTGTARLDGETYTLGEEIQYTDLVDIPERKSDLVDGTYDVAMNPASTLPVAIRITDMLGEEVLVVEDPSAE